jgi:enoyl-CoA hydratase
MKGEDAIHAGFADFYVPRARLGDLKSALVESGDVSVIERFSETPPASALARQQAEIDRLFAGKTVADILASLRSDGSDWALKAAEAIEKGSPLSALMILSTVREASSMENALRNEYRFVSRVLEHGDFLEGIRAIVIDKDRNPVWRHADIASVPSDLLTALRSPAEGGDINLRDWEDRL